MGIGERPSERRAGVTRDGWRPLAPAEKPDSGSDIRFIALAFLAGVLFICALPTLPPLWAFLPALAACLCRFRFRAYLLALVAAAMWTSALGDHLLSQRLPVAADNSRIWLQGTIENIPEADEQRTRFQFVTDTRPHRVRVSWYDDAPALQPGDCWRLRLKVNLPHGSLNPGGFDYETWLWRERIGATGYVRDAQRCGSDKSAYVGRWRDAAAGRLADALDQHPMSGVILALSMGVRGGINDDQWQVFRHTGTSHLVAISGLHIGLVAAWVLFMMRWLAPRLPSGNRFPAITVAAVASALVAALYALIAGFALPTQRALIMLLVVLGALLLRRRTAASNLLALAALVVLVFDPFAVLSPGFWLSFGAVAWILYLVRARIGAPAWTTWLALQPALVLGLAPLTLFWFGEASLAAPLANALLIPVFTLLVPFVLVVVGATLVLPTLGTPLLAGLAQIMGLGWTALEWLAKLPASHLALPQPGLITVLIALAGVALLLAPRGVPARWLGLIALAPLFITPAAPAPQGYRLTLLDVGQGLAAVVRTAEHTLLFDAGPRYRTGFDAGEALVLPHLRSQGITRLDRVVVSHGDIDHRGGIQAVRAGIPVTTNALPCQAGQHWHWDGVDFRFLHPDSGDWSGNNRSCVLKVIGPGGSLLLTGDIESAAERHLLAKYDLTADVVVVPHHGSATSSSPEFVAAVAASQALIPAGRNNRWKFPSGEVVQRYEADGALLTNTASSGAITIDFDPVNGVSAPRAARQRQQRFWHHH